MDMQYIYTPVEEGFSQYDDYDFCEQNIVPAAYVQAKASMDSGNCFIEALPYPRHDQEINRAYTRTIPDYDYEKISNLGTWEKIIQVSMLRELRFPLPFHKNLESVFYNTLLTSYRVRFRMKARGKRVQYVCMDKTQETGSILVGNSAGSTNAGFSLIGFSGCGKSSAIEILTSHYPQVIMHKDADAGYFPQIVYLVVNCIPNSNFSALYESIGNAIDKAFGNINPIYKKEVSRIVGLGKKADKIREYVEKFSIGIIIFDEIQLIDFSHTRENSFDSLLRLANETKVGIAVVGTEDARGKMFHELRTSRRVGNMINGNRYCENYNYCAYLVSRLFRYQWFDKPIQPTEEIAKTMYEVSYGIVDQLVGIYSFMHYDYLYRDKKPKIDGAYIRTIAKKYYPDLSKIIANIESDGAEEQLAALRKNAEEKAEAFLDEAKQRKEEESIISQSEEAASIDVHLSNVVANINNIYDEYSGTKIEEAFEKVMRRKTSQKKTEKEITRLVVEQLQKTIRRRNTKQKVKYADEHQMRDFLGINE